MSRIELEPLQKSTLGEWFETAAGQYVLDWEHRQIDSAVEDVFGFNAAQVGTPGIAYLRANRMSLRFVIGTEAGSALAADPAHLPIAAASLDSPFGIKKVVGSFGAQSFDVDF